LKVLHAIVITIILFEMLILVPATHTLSTAWYDGTVSLWTFDRVHPLRIFAGHLSDTSIIIKNIAIESVDNGTNI
jgi:hypothetical protein